MNCPDCGGAMWDNRESKRNPKAPDYKCKDRNCGKGVWDRAAKGGQNGGGPRQQTGKGSSREVWTWGDLFEAYSVCQARILKMQGEKATPESINAGVATLLIAAEKLNLPGPVTAKKRQEAVKAAEEAAKKAREQAAREDNDDFPPFEGEEAPY